MTRSVKMNVNTGVLTLQQAQKREIKELTATVNLMVRLSSTIGFYRFYYLNLKNYKTVNDCFNAVNKLCFDLFGVERYASYYQFKNIIKLA